MNIRAAQSIKCGQSVWITYMPSLLHSLPLHITALYLGTSRWLSKLILEGYYDISCGQPPACNHSLLPAEQKPPSKSFLNALCMSVNCPCTMPRRNQKSTETKLVIQQGCQACIFITMFTLQYINGPVYGLQCYEPNDDLLGSYMYRTNLVQHFRGTSEKRFGSGGC